VKDNFSYYMPTKIVYGKNSLNDIDKYINGRKTILITSQGFIKRGLEDKIKSLTGNIVEVVSEVKSHPEFKDLENIYNRIKGIDFELILAVGGGSVLDAAKFFSVQNHRKEYKFVEDLTKGTVKRKNYDLIPIISIPTTAGTSSEITPWATIWDMEEKKKYSLHLPDLFAEIAIYDPVLTLSVPENITIQTGVDALSHALESIWNKNANPITIEYAIKSSKLIMDNLLRLVGDLENLECRDNMMMACMYSGLAFSNTQTAIAHSMSYYITANKNVEHGIACSFTLPLLIDKIIGRYDFIDSALMEVFGELSSQKIRDMLKELNISMDFSDYGVVEEEVLLNMDNIRSNNSLIDMKMM